MQPDHPDRTTSGPLFDFSLIMEGLLLLNGWG